MIRNIRHTGIVVRNLDNAIRFYEGLGFSICKREVEKGPYIDKIVGLDNAEIEIAKLKSPCGGLLELLKYQSHQVEKEISNQPSNQIGCSHIALTVKNIDQTLKYIRKNGGSTCNVPARLPGSALRVAYCHDFEGNLVEIVEDN